MSAGDHLSQQQFPRLFHGSVSDLRGDHLIPDGGLGASGGQDEWDHFGQSKKQYVSASDDESKAWDFAHKARGQMPITSGRPRVYEVEPHPETKIGIENQAHPTYQRENSNGLWGRKPTNQGEHVAPSFKVIAQHDTRPGAQGTFPGVDWHKHVDPKKEMFASVNHPHSARPEYESHEHEAYHEQMKRRMADRMAKKAEPTQQGLF